MLTAEDRARLRHLRENEGWTLAELADEFGVSREYTRRLTSEVPLDTVMAARHARAYERAATDVTDIMDEWRSGKSVRDIARERGHTLRVVRAIVTDNSSELDARQRQNGHSEDAARDELIKWIRRYAEIYGRTPSFSGFSNWVETGRPTAMTAYRMFGSWSAACTAAGLRPNRSPKREYKRRWSDADLVAAVRRCRNDIGHLPSCAQYNAWAAGRDEPSSATIRLHLGTWMNALNQL